MRYGLLLIFLLNIVANAEAALSCADETSCVTEQKLHLSLAVGYGQRSNPLYDGEKLPLVLLPDIYYYGEHWFFDNGKLGSSWQLNDQWQLSLISRLNPEKGYFQKWFSGNIFQLNQSYSHSSILSDLNSPRQLSLGEVSKRPTAVDLGLQLDWFSNDWHLQTLFWQDISNAYNGQHASISAGRHWQTSYGNWQLNTTLYWKSAKLIDTYYGIDNNEPFYISRYNGKASWQPELRLGWQQPLSKDFALLAFVRYLHLDDAMTNSPLVRTDNIVTWFFGVSYRLF